jgi:hypothetical protein
MPSHIFTRVGAWQDSVAGNRRSADVAKKDGNGNEAFHAADYMVYANLQLGRHEEARKVIQEFDREVKVNPAIFVGPYAAAAIPARLALEAGDWSAAARLHQQETRFPFVAAITTFARALGSARQGEVAAAEKEAQALELQHKALLDAKNNYWATEVEVQRLAAAGWIAQARGDNAEAVRLMRAAADLEDRNEKHIVTPGACCRRASCWRNAARRQAAGEALKEFEQSQQREPNRLRGFAGAAQAAEAAGDREKARRYHGMLVELTKQADTPLPAVERAKTYLASR